MRRALSTISLVPVIALLAAATPAAAPGASGDAAATSAYLQANYTLVRTATSHLGRAEAALKQLAAAVKAQCPRAAAGSPQNVQSEQLSNELVGAMTVVGSRPARGAVATFVRRVAGLRWSDPALTRAVHDYARSVAALTTLGKPPVCGDVGAWAASGYLTLPPATAAFDARFFAVDVPIGEIPARLRSQPLSSAERALIARSVPLEDGIAEFEALEVDRWGSIMDAMQLLP